MNSPFNAEKLTNTRLAKENTRLIIELEKEKAAHLGDQEARSNKLPSVVQFKQTVIPQEAEGTQFSHLIINKQAMQQRLDTQLKDVHALKH